MQPALVATAVIVGVGAFVACIVWLIRRELAAQAAVESAWRAFAARRHLQWNDASGPWIRRKGYSMVGELDGVRATIDQYIVSNGKTSVRYTRVGADLERAAPERLLVSRKTLNNRLHFAWQGPLVELDDSTNAQPLLVRCRSERFARSVVDNRVCAALYSMPPRTYIECRDRQAKVWWLGYERETAMLDRAAGLLATVVRAAGKG